MQRRETLRTRQQPAPELAQLQQATGDALRASQRDRRLREHHSPFDGDPVETPSTATPDHPIFRFNSDERLTELSFVGNADVAKNGTDFATMIFRLRDGIGGAAKIVAKKATSDGAWLAWRPVDFDIGGEQPAGGVLSVEVTKGGAGKAVPDGVIRAVTVEVAP